MIWQLFRSGNPLVLCHTPPHFLSFLPILWSAACSRAGGAGAGLTDIPLVRGLLSGIVVVAKK